MIEEQKYRHRNLVWYFLIMLCAIGVYYFTCVVLRGKGFASVYILDRADTFMDHFNSLTNANIDPYMDGRSNYPAMACLIYKILAHGIPMEIRGASTGGDLAFIYRAHQIPVMLFLLLFIVALWIVFTVTQKRVEGIGTAKYILNLLIILCAPMMFALERGNLILLSFVLSFFFAFHYDDDNKVIKELAFLALAIAAAIKIYPAILGLLVVKKRKIADILRLLLYGVLCFVLPFFAYDGLESLKIMIEALRYTNNLTSTTGYGVNVSLYNICETIMLAFGKSMDNRIAFIVYVLTVAILFISFFTIQKRWKEHLCAVLLIILLPKTNYYYVMIFLLIPFVEMVADYYEQGFTFKRDYRYAGLFALFFTPIALPVIPLFSEYAYPLYFTMFLYYLGLLCTVVFLFTDLLFLRNNHKGISAVPWVIDSIAILFCCTTVVILA